MSDEFTRHIFRLILARAAQTKEFSSISETALEILIDAVIFRLSAFARTAASITSHCGRTDTNGLDVFAALSRHGETPESLSVYLRKGEHIPAFDFLVDPYPLARLPRLFSSPSQQSGTAPAIPFRANTTFVPSQATSKHIPPFFPAHPSRYTYDRGVQPDPVVPDDPELVKKREADQALIKKALSQISAGRAADAPHAVDFECELTRMAGGEMISKPTALLESPTYALDGVRGREDPEFLPLSDLGEATLVGEPTRDQAFLLQILSIRQGTTEPGTLKHATYNPGGAGGTPDKDRAQSPQSA
jgi:hypothetical protein